MSIGENDGAKAPLLNVANVLTVLRLILVPVFVAVYWSDTPVRSALAWFVFALAAATDKADGYLARSRGLILLSWQGHLWWWVTAVMIGRELAITAVRMTVVKKAVMAAGRGGKMKMFFQSMGIAGILIPWASFLPAALAAALLWLSYGLLAVALYFSLVSAAGYVRDARAIARAG